MANLTGRLNKRVSLHNETASTPDGDGGFTKTWTALDPASVFAAIMPATPSQMERVLASTIQSSTSHIVEMRYHASVSTKTRITFGSRYLYVRGVQNVDEKGELLRLTCDEVIA